MFPAHGQWQIAVHNDYVLQWFGGCWNEEAAIQYTQEYKEKTTHLVGKKWAMLSIFEDWQLGVPEIEPHIVKHCQRFKDIGCIKDCHIYSPNAAKEMQLEQLVPQTEGSYERRVFTNIDDALAWLRSCDFNIEIDNFLQRIKAIGFAND
ncbi:MAG: hypothetical protein OQK09_08570 [Colwellia sp.]|nr:hypothetical protein [Colwellia sp.]MCW8864581.1 hypothetical protein [Colwellia sp.]MCW9081553.1 hypothetical protein [Colwellia sp.]